MMAKNTDGRKEIESLYKEYYMDLNILFFCDQMSNAISVAAYLGLLPASPNVIGGFETEGVEIKVSSDVETNGLIKSLKAGAEVEGESMEFNTITILSSEMQVVDKD